MSTASDQDPQASDPRFLQRSVYEAVQGQSLSARIVTVAEGVEKPTDLLTVTITEIEALPLKGRPDFCRQDPFTVLLDSDSDLPGGQANILLNAEGLDDQPVFAVQISPPGQAGKRRLQILHN